MTLESVVIISLVLLNFAQFVFWSGQNQKLVDKLMSGSFSAYKAAQTIGEPKFEDQKQQEVRQDFSLMQDFNI